jgi:two-component system, OmpR family, response regulator
MARLFLVIEDEDCIALQRRHELARFGIRTYVVPSFEHALEALKSWQFDAILLTASALGPRCLELLKHLRARRAAPVLMLIDRCDEGRQIAALEAGATDVMQASVSSELVAVKLLRLLDIRLQSLGFASKILPQVGSLTIDERGSRASVDGVTLDLTPYQFQLIALLASKSGEVISRQDVVQILMGTSDLRVVDVQVSRIRKKLTRMNVNDVVLRTVRGRGYSLAANPPALECVGSRPHGRLGIVVDAAKLFRP